MTDRLDRSLRALRDSETGESPEAEETLSRVLASGSKARGARSRRARLWMPMAAVLAFSIAALAHTFPARRAEMPETSSEPFAPARPDAASGRPPTTLPALRAPAVEELAPTASAPEPPSPSRPVVARARPALALASGAVPAPAMDAPAAAAPPSPAPVEDSPEAGVYTRAHRLHFDGDAAAALAAWDAYLLQFPDGRFVSDARYNRAIDLVKLRRYADARAALLPFADGAFGGYHRGDARRLLASIP